MIFLNDSKDKIEIVVRSMIDHQGKCRYRIEDIRITPHRKRKFISLASQIRDRYDYRVLDRDGRIEYIRNEYLKYCTEDQMWKAVQEAHEKMAPIRDEIEYMSL